MDEQHLLDRIYEAGVFQSYWPQVLEDIAVFVGAKGGNLIRTNAGGTTLISSPSVAALTQEFVSGGWNEKNVRVTRLLDHSPHPGFLTDADLCTPAELCSLPVYTEFLTPHNADAGAASLMQGFGNEALIVAIECFPDQRSAFAAIATLNALRPHLARSLIIGQHVATLQTSKVVQSFELMQLPVALLDKNGKLLTATSMFSDFLGSFVYDGKHRLTLGDPVGDSQLQTALRGLAKPFPGASIGVRDKDGVGRAALHLIPAKRDACDVHSQVHSFVILSHPKNSRVPGADLISALFDLTPAEARLARAMAYGKSLKDAAKDFETSEETLRTQLKKVFMKTSTRRQGELALLLSRLSH